jgi:hypothetical protein
MKSAVKVFAFMLIVSQGGVRKLDAQTNEMQAGYFCPTPRKGLISREGC